MAWIIRDTMLWSRPFYWSSEPGWTGLQRNAYRFFSLMDAREKAAHLGDCKVLRLKPKPAKGEEYESVGWVYDNGKSPVVVWTDGALANMGRDSWLTSSFRNGRCDGGRVVVYRKVPR